MWPIVGAGLILALLVANAIAYRRRTGSIGLWGTASDPRGRLSGSRIALSILVTVALLAALAVPKVAPDTDFAVWISNPVSFVAYLIWVLFAATLLSVLPRVREILRKARSRNLR